MEDNKEEMIEEINETTSSDESAAEVSTKNTAGTDEMTEIIDDSSTTVTKEEADLINSVYKKKSKVPILILLSFLLFLDIAALVIYIIGINKVLSFIK